MQPNIFNNQGLVGGSLGLSLLPSKLVESIVVIFIAWCAVGTTAISFLQPAIKIAANNIAAKYTNIRTLNTSFLVKEGRRHCFRAGSALLLPACPAMSFQNLG